MIPGIMAQAVAGKSAGLTERWWRVRFPAGRSGNTTMTGSNPYIDIRQIMMSTTPSGPNLVEVATEMKASIGAIANAVSTGAALWNNGGIGPLAGDMWGAFKLPTPDALAEVKVRNGSITGYSPWTVIVESSWDGIEWTFEWGQAFLSWGGTETKTLARPAINWATDKFEHWMVGSTMTADSNAFALYEMEMAETIDGPNLATGGTAIGRNNSTYPLTRLTDGNLTTLRGAISPMRMDYCGYQFATPQNINQVRMWNHTEERFLKGYLAASPTGAAPWYVKQEIDINRSHGNTAWSKYDFRNPRNPAGASGPHRHWRIRAGHAGPISLADATYAVAELDFKAGGVSLIGSGTPSSLTQYNATMTPDKAFDGDPETAWASTNNRQTFQWLAYDFATPVRPDQFIVRARNDAYWNQMFSIIALDWSDDGEQWYRHRTYVVSEIAGAGQSQTFDI